MKHIKKEKKINMQDVENIHESLINFWDDIDNIPELPRYISKKMQLTISKYVEVITDLKMHMPFDESGDFLILKEEKI